MSYVIESGSSKNGNIPHTRVVVTTPAEWLAAVNAWLATAPFDDGDFIEVYNYDAGTRFAFLEMGPGGEWFIEVNPS